MKALISPLEDIANGYRVTDVSLVGFEVAEPLFWVNCTSRVKPETHYYDPVKKTVLKITTE